MNLNLRAQLRKRIAARLDAERKAADYDQLHAWYAEWRALAEDLQDETERLVAGNARTARWGHDWKTHAETLVRNLAQAERVIARQNRVTDQLRFERDYLLGERIRDLRTPAVSAPAVDEPSAALPIYREAVTAETRVIDAVDQPPTAEWAPVGAAPPPADTTATDPATADDDAPVADADADLDELQLLEATHA